MADESKSQGKGATSLALGIIGLILNYTVPISILSVLIVAACAGIGLGLGIAAVKNPNESKGMAITGIVLCGLLILLFIIGFLIGFGQGLNGAI